MIMKAKECIEKPRTGKWIKRMAMAAAAFIMFSYLYSRGISPVWAAVAIVCFRGFFRFLYKIACLSGSGGDTFLSSAAWYSDSTGIQYREMKQMRHINHCNTLQDRDSHPNPGRLFWYPILYEDKDDGIRDGKEREAYTAIGRPGTQRWHRFRTAS